jgi:hypothetical protein
MSVATCIASCASQIFIFSEKCEYVTNTQTTHAIPQKMRRSNKQEKQMHDSSTCIFGSKLLLIHL